jgi:L-amino acid N-acyltransferase YncA
VIRPADPARDAAACAAIYAAYLKEGWASFEEEAPDADEISRRIASSHLWLVSEQAGEVTGFAYATQHRPRAAYRWTVETTIYLERCFHGRGIGRALYEALLSRLAERGFRNALAVIALPNPASVALHESLGFELIGIFARVGFKAGAWRDVGWWQRALGSGEGDDLPPCEPSGP